VQEPNLALVETKRITVCASFQNVKKTMFFLDIILWETQINFLLDFPCLYCLSIANFQMRKKFYVICGNYGEISASWQQ
jgi:hypothetical protein